MKRAVPLKYLTNICRLLEMPLINCKVELLLAWDPNWVLPNLVGASTFTITNAKLYVPVVTLSTEDNTKLSKLVSEGFKRPVYWNKCKIIPNKIYDENDYIKNCLMLVNRELRDCLFLLIEIAEVLIELPLILAEDTSFQE